MKYYKFYNKLYAYLNAKNTKMYRGVTAENEQRQYDNDLN